MDSYGKIFVVVAVLALILLGIFVYLFFLDRKVSKLEKEISEKESQKQE
ncbi:MAG: CcmD family protein [Bacteroidota bacterium]